MKIGIISEDIRLCHQLALMCNENDIEIIFISQSDDLIDNLNYVVIDIDIGEEESIKKCSEYNNINCTVFGVTEFPKKSIILNAKKAGCLIVLTKSNFSDNLLDIIKKQI